MLHLVPTWPAISSCGPPQKKNNLEAEIQHSWPHIKHSEDFINKIKGTEHVHKMLFSLQQILLSNIRVIPTILAKGRLELL